MWRVRVLMATHLFTIGKRTATDRACGGMTQPHMPLKMRPCRKRPADACIGMGRMLWGKRRHSVWENALVAPLFVDPHVVSPLGVGKKVLVTHVTHKGRMATRWVSVRLAPVLIQVLALRKDKVTSGTVAMVEPRDARLAQRGLSVQHTH